METFLKENWFKFGVLLALIFIGWVGYQALVVQPQEVRAEKQMEEASKTVDAVQKAAQEAQDAAIKERKLQICLSAADENYQANFESYCISEGRGSNCNSIKAVNVDRVEAIEKDEKDTCFRFYK